MIEARWQIRAELKSLAECELFQSAIEDFLIENGTFEWELYQISFEEVRND